MKHECVDVSSILYMGLNSALDSMREGRKWAEKYQEMAVRCGREIAYSIAIEEIEFYRGRASAFLSMLYRLDVMPFETWGINNDYLFGVFEELKNEVKYHE